MSSFATGKGFSSGNFTWEQFLAVTFTQPVSVGGGGGGPIGGGGIGINKGGCNGVVVGRLALPRFAPLGPGLS